MKLLPGKGNNFPTITNVCIGSSSLNLTIFHIKHWFNSWFIGLFVRSLVGLFVWSLVGLFVLFVRSLVGLLVDINYKVCLLEKMPGAFAKNQT